MKLGFLILVACAAFTGCAAHTNLEPLGKSTVAPHATFGGPVVKALDRVQCESVNCGWVNA